MYTDLVSISYRWFTKICILSSSSYVDTTGKQLVSSGDFNNNVELGSGGSELIITTRTDDRLSIKSIGSREFLRYYRQKPKPTRTNDTAISSA